VGGGGGGVAFTIPQCEMVGMGCQQGCVCWGGGVLVACLMHVHFGLNAIPIGGCSMEPMWTRIKQSPNLHVAISRASRALLLLLATVSSKYCTC
jgi:hypothetical protein